jgi:tRNA threonylcarbamoyladenosine biosynthesis protein TsaB
MKGRMPLLAIDTTTDACSVALMDNDEIIEDFVVAPREQSQRLLPMIEKIFAEAGCCFSRITCIAVTTGPGSFTGIRVGAAAAQGLALAYDLPMVGVSTLATMAEGCRRQHDCTEVLSLLDARMGEVYWGHYRFDLVTGLMQGEDTLSVPADICWSRQGAWVGAGLTVAEPNFDTIAPQMFIVPSFMPHARDLFPFAKQAVAREECASAHTLSIQYLRQKVVQS